MIEVDGLIENVVARVGRRRLVGGHATEQCICPTGCLARLVMILLCLTACTDTCGGIVLVEDTALKVSRSKISHG